MCCWHVFQVGYEDVDPDEKAGGAIAGLGMILLVFILTSFKVVVATTSALALFDHPADTISRASELRGKRFVKIIPFFQCVTKTDVRTSMIIDFSILMQNQTPIKAPPDRQE